MTGLLLTETIENLKCFELNALLKNNRIFFISKVIFSENFQVGKDSKSRDLS